MDKEQAIREAGRIWNKSVAELPELKKRIRAEAEAQIDREVEQRRAAAARAVKYARDRGATKVALREVTTKDHRDFESYVKLGDELARLEGDWVPEGEQ
jgi:F0F1-type ATP synthase membrane subunit b/b'